LIERSLYFALGFFMAVMMALAVLPAFWRRAYRLTRREVEATLPLSPREIAAERDQLRAKFAVERVQLEQQIEVINAKRHGAMKETGSKTTTIANLGNTLEARQGDIQALSTERALQETNLSQTHQNLLETRKALEERSADLQVTTAAKIETRSKLDSAEALIKNKSADIAALKSNMAVQFQRVEDMAAALRSVKEQLKTSSDEAKASERKLREAEKDRSILGRKLESAEELATRRDVTLADRDHKLSILHTKAIALAAAGKELETSLKQEQRKNGQADALLKAREEAITRIREDSAQTARDLTKSIDKIRTDRQRLQSDLSEMRSRAALVQRELNALKRSVAASEPKLSRMEERTLK
jgi:hypothetical protein